MSQIGSSYTWSLSRHSFCMRCKFIYRLNYSICFLQQNLVQPNASKETLCQDHFFAIFCIFSCIFLASYMLMNSSANMFYSTGLVLLTFQDALSLVEQVGWNLCCLILSYCYMYWIIEGYGFNLHIKHV